MNEWLSIRKNDDQTRVETKSFRLTLFALGGVQNRVCQCYAALMNILINKAKPIFGSWTYSGHHILDTCLFYFIESFRIERFNIRQNRISKKV